VFGPENNQEQYFEVPDPVGTPYLMKVTWDALALEPKTFLT
jgi:hypothetical protein